jgi:lysophospholipase L1-like esterase
VATVALFGDSTYQTWYLNASLNPLLVTYHEKAADYNGALDRVVEASLAALGVTATVTNRGQGGLDTAEALAGTTWDACIASNPDVVVIGFGVNDQAEITATQFGANLQVMVTEAIAAGIVPVLATPNYIDYPTHYTSDYNTTLDPFAAEHLRVARANNITLIDVRKALRDAIAAGTWDLYGHNDATYLATWENGSEPGTPAHYTNVHQWFAGNQIIADTMAARLHEHEPLLGGTAGLPFRCAGRALGRMATEPACVVRSA